MNRLLFLLLPAAIAFAADPLDSWTDVTAQTGTGNQFTTVTFGNGLFVAGTTNGKLYRSTNGVTWTESQSDITSSIQPLLYVHGRYFARANHQWFTSADAIQWTSLGFTPAQDAIDSIVYWLGNWYATGSTSATLKSANFTDWTIDTAFYGVGFSNEQIWVGWASSPSYALHTVTSTGVTDFNNRAFALYTSGIFLCMDVGTLTIYKATDGLTWSPIPNLSYAALAGLNNFEKVGDVFLVAGGNIFSSTDFSTWNSHPTAPTLAGRDTLAAGNSFVMAVGADNHLYRSQNVGPAAPMIVQDPFDLTVKVGGTISLTVVASGDALSYKWRHNSNEISGATSATLTINSASVTNSGAYDVIVSNPYGSVTSKAAAVAVDFFAVNLYAGLTINGQIGQVYQIEARPVIGQNLQWTPVTQVTLTETNQIWYDRTTPTNSMRLFRAIFPQ